MSFEKKSVFGYTYPKKIENMFSFPFCFVRKSPTIAHNLVPEEAKTIYGY